MRTRFVQPRHVEVMIVNDRDAVGTATFERLQAQNGLVLTGSGGPPPAYGIEGTPGRRFDGDLGPLQTGGTARTLLNAGAVGWTQTGDRTGLPISKIPSATLRDASPYSARGQFGVR